MQSWVLLGVLMVAELVMLVRIPSALLSGAVPLNPLGWIGYGELMEASVERENAPGAFWLIVALMATAAVFFGCVIYLAIARGLG
ncbi:MAG TPA: hypothetical protein VFC56_06235 [Stellaceae bacterium]|nr:hypothetical protein [Stellaceae bacterium]